MPNNTTLSISEAGSLILSRPYLLWLEKDVFPYIFGTTCLIAILLGIIFNIAVCKLFAKQEHVGIRRTITLLVAVDVLAEVFVLAPGMFISYSKLEDLPGTYCTINGMFNLATFLIQFGLLSLALATSFITLVQHKLETEYPTTCKHFFSIVCICLVSITLAAIPTTWKDGFVYRTSEYQCGPNRSIKKAYINGIFSISVFISLILAFTVSIVLLKRFLSRNTKVSELRHTLSEETVTMDDQTGSHNRTAEPESDKRRNRFISDETVSIEDHTIQFGIAREDMADRTCNRFRSDVTVSMEDQTKLYGIAREGMPDRSCNRFRSDVTVSMEDQTKSYGNIPTQSGITVSMEDRTHSYCKNFRHCDSDTTTYSELTSFRKSTDPTVNCLRATGSSDTSLQTALDILDKEYSANIDYPNVCVISKDSDKRPCENDHSHPTCLNKVAVTSQHYCRDSDDESSLDDTYGPGIISTAASMSNRSTRNSVRSTMTSFKRANGDIHVENKNILEKLLQSAVMDKTLKLATINIIVSFAVLACWSPFIIMVYIDMYGSLWWEGWSAMAVLCAYISYCLKPFIILGISGQLVQASKAVLPKSVEDRADRMASVLTQTIGKVSNKIY